MGPDSPSRRLKPLGPVRTAPVAAVGVTGRVVIGSWSPRSGCFPPDAYGDWHRRRLAGPVVAPVWGSSGPAWGARPGPLGPVLSAPDPLW